MEAHEALRSYAATYQLVIFTDRVAMATQCQITVDDIPEGVSAMAFFPDHTVMMCPAYVRSGGLFRFGAEDDECPDEETPTSLEELMSRGDPRNSL